MAVLAAWSGVDPGAMATTAIVGMALGVAVVLAVVKGAAGTTAAQPRWLPIVASTMALGAALAAARAHHQPVWLLGLVLLSLLLLVPNVLRPISRLPFGPHQSRPTSRQASRQASRPTSRPASRRASAGTIAVALLVAPFVVASGAAYLCLPDTESSVTVATGLWAFLLAVLCADRVASRPAAAAMPPFGPTIDPTIDRDALQLTIFDLTPLAVGALAVNAFVASGPNPESAIAALACVVMASIVAAAMPGISAPAGMALAAMLACASVVVARIGGVRTDDRQAAVVGVGGIVVTAAASLAVRRFASPSAPS